MQNTQNAAKIPAPLDNWAGSVQ